MARAIWNGTVIAESAACETVEGNLCFPPCALKMACFAPNARTTICSWKGTASCYDIVVDGKRNEAAAWVYRNPRPEAANIRDMVAFRNGVTVEQ